MNQLNHSLFLLFFVAFFNIVNGQNLKDFKVANNENREERKSILDIARNEVKKEINQDVIFVVNHFKVSGNYAWLEANAVRKDGKTIEFPDESFDCCHVEGLFQKVAGKWRKIEFGAFSTDCWFCGIAGRYKEVNEKIFSQAARSKN